MGVLLKRVLSGCDLMAGESDHVSLQVGEGGHIEEVLDEFGGGGLAQPQEHGVSVLQQEHPRVGQPLLRAA